MQIARGTEKPTSRNASPSATWPPPPPLRCERAATIADNDPSPRNKQERTAATNRGGTKAGFRRTVTGADLPKPMGKPLAGARVVATTILAAEAGVSTTTTIAGDRRRGEANVERKDVTRGGAMRTRGSNGRDDAVIGIATESERAVAMVTCRRCRRRTPRKMRKASPRNWGQYPLRVNGLHRLADGVLSASVPVLGEAPAPFTIETAEESPGQAPTRTVLSRCWYRPVGLRRLMVSVVAAAVVVVGRPIETRIGGVRG